MTMIPRLWAIGCWRNEATLARVNVLHHLAQGVSRFLILDHESTDGTFEILRRMAERHPITVRRHRGSFEQAELVSKLADEARRNGADWVLPIDADEFWYAPNASLTSVLAGTSTSITVPVVNFVQERRSYQDHGADGLLTMVYSAVRDDGPESRRQAEVWGNAIAYVEYPYPPKLIHRAAPDLRISWGNHARGDGSDPPVSQDVICLHAPLRSREALFAKADRSRPTKKVEGYLGVAWHLSRWRRMDDHSLAKEWAANSQDGGLLDVYGGSRPARPDKRLSDLVRPWLTFEAPQTDAREREWHSPNVVIWGISVVRNEADIIETCVRHHLTIGVERILIIDNGSTDGTPEVLERLERSLPVQWTREAGAFKQDALITRLAREAFSRGGTWVLPFDADEFWCVEPPHTLRSVLSSTRATAIRCEVLNFAQDRRVAAGGPEALLHMRFRPARTVGPPLAGQRAVESGVAAYVEAEYPGKWISRASPHLSIARGNHSIDGLVGRTTHGTPIVCLHAPLRSRSILNEKAVHGRRLDSQDLDPSVGWHVRRWARMTEEQLDHEWEANSCPAVAQNDDSPTPRFVVDERLSAAVGSALSVAGLNQAVEPTVRLADRAGLEDLVLAPLPGIDGWLTREEAGTLARAVDLALRESDLDAASAAVEIGSYCGRSTAVIAGTIRHLGSPAKLFAIDPHEGVTGATDTPVGLECHAPTFARLMNTLESLGLGQHVCVIRSRSYEVAWGRAISILFVDGLHDAISVWSDIEHFEPWLRPGGRLVLHDVSPTFPGVQAAFDRLLATRRFVVDEQVNSLVSLRKR
jgi:glycosyltransferase involved in cell wall biosynthesis